MTDFDPGPHSGGAQPWCGPGGDAAAPQPRAPEQPWCGPYGDIHGPNQPGPTCYERPWCGAGGDEVVRQNHLAPHDSISVNHEPPNPRIPPPGLARYHVFGGGDGPLRPGPWVAEEEARLPRPPNAAGPR